MLHSLFLLISKPSHAQFKAREESLTQSAICDLRVWPTTPKQWAEADEKPWSGLRWVQHVIKNDPFN